MMIKCDRHGLQPAVQVSPDLFEDFSLHRQPGPAISVSYEYQGQLVDALYLSRKYDDGVGYDRSVTIPLPDEYPDWIGGLRLLCRVCFLEASEKGAEQSLSAPSIPRRAAMEDLDQVISQVEQQSRVPGAFPHLPEIVEALKEYRGEEDAARKERLASGISRLVMENIDFAKYCFGGSILEVLEA